MEMCLKDGYIRYVSTHSIIHNAYNMASIFRIFNVMLKIALYRSIDET